YPAFPELVRSAPARRHFRCGELDGLRSKNRRLPHCTFGRRRRAASGDDGNRGSQRRFLGPASGFVSSLRGVVLGNRPPELPVLMRQALDLIGKLPLLAAHFGHGRLRHAADPLHARLIVERCALRGRPPWSAFEEERAEKLPAGVARCIVGELWSAHPLSNSGTRPRCVATVDVELGVAVERVEEVVDSLAGRLRFESQRTQRSSSENGNLFHLFRPFIRTVTRCSRLGLRGGRARAECREYDQRQDCESAEPKVGSSSHRNRFDQESSLYEGRRNRTVLEYRIVARCRPNSKNRRLVACRNPQLAKPPCLQA